MSDKRTQLLQRKAEIYNNIAKDLEDQVASMTGGAKINGGDIKMTDNVIRIESLPDHKTGLKRLIEKYEGVDINEFIKRF